MNIILNGEVILLKEVVYSNCLIFSIELNTLAWDVFGVEIFEVISAKVRMDIG